MRNFKAVICYDGTRYRGWQRQGNTANTIQARLESDLTALLRQPVEVAGSGRTDAGAHARGQVISFHADTALPAPEILRGLRGRLPADIGVVLLEDAPPRFHARLSARSKTYCYRIWDADAPCVFDRRYVWRRQGALDSVRMQRAADALLGTHDFAAFCTMRSKKKSTVRTLTELTVTRVGDEVQIRATADGFLYNMVRILAGTLAEIGDGSRAVAAAAAALAARDRTLAGPTAPAQGLCLMEVRY